MSELDKIVQNEKWITEVETHHNIKSLGDEHIIEFIAAIEQGTAHYLLFRWADQGNLRGLWEKYHSPRLSPALVKDVVVQLKGLTNALFRLHNYRNPKAPNNSASESNYRHGDLKPENILSVSTRPGPHSDSHPHIGTLKMCDLGLTKHHNVATDLREQTSTRATTLRYQPPEVFTIEQQNRPVARSRRYDVWSMGCVILEFVIWMLYGYESLEQFNKAIRNPEFQERAPWFETKHEAGKGKTAKVHGVVEETIRFILANDPECQGKTALREILELVRDRLLVVELGGRTMSERTRSFRDGPSSANSLPIIQVDHVPTVMVSEEDQQEDDTFNKVRAESKEVNGALADVITEGARRGESYWFTGEDRSNVWLDLGSITRAAGITDTDYLSPEAARRGASIERPILPGNGGNQGFLGGLSPGLPSSSTVALQVCLSSPASNFIVGNSRLTYHVMQNVCYTFPGLLFMIIRTAS